MALAGRGGYICRRCTVGVWKVGKRLGLRKKSWRGLGTAPSAWWVSRCLLFKDRLGLADGLLDFCACEALLHQELSSLFERRCLNFWVRQKLHRTGNLVFSYSTTFLSRRSW
jgi:hypothetical protein